MTKKLYLIGSVLLVIIVFCFILINVEKRNKTTDMSPSLNLELSTQGDLKVGNEILIKLIITPTSDLGKEFFDAPAKIRLTLPDSFEIIEGNTNQEIYFNDFNPRLIEIKVKPTKKGTFDIKSDVEKQNSGNFWKTLTVNIE